MTELSSHATELVRLINSHLANHATQFAPTSEVPLGPLGTRPDALAAATELFHHFGWNAAAPSLFRETQQDVMND